MAKVINRKNGNNIKIYATTLEDVALEQIKELGEFEPYQDSKIRIMPDCHAGAGCTIGTTMEIKDKITPNLVGVDIGCGMLTVKLNETEIDLQKLDAIITEFVPNGFNVHSKPKAEFEFDKLIAKNLNIERAKLSIGSLGGGNHFIEVGENSKGELFLVIHSGSRNIGGQVAKYYQDIAIGNLTDNSKEREKLIERLKKEGRHKEISKELKKLKKPVINKDLAYLIGSDFNNYMHDMELMQKYAVLNRRTMANIILEKTWLTEYESFETIHNYIDFNRMMLRKGAVSAEKNEILLIPINMRDGSIIAKGKGNADWNYSAPHGAGRLMGRNEAHRTLDFNEFKEQMKDIYSTSVLSETLDEAPNAYKPMAEILEAIKETAEVIDIIKPIYNFKAHS
jgi:RNA-splicing ligase RtcB